MCSLTCYNPFQGTCDGVFTQGRRIPVGEKLQLLGTKLVLIQQDMVVARPVGALDTSMAVQVEVELCGVADVPVNQSSCSR